MNSYIKSERINEMRHALNDFERAFHRLQVAWDGVGGSQVGWTDYPFEKSFDEYHLTEWVRATERELNTLEKVSGRVVGVTPLGSIVSYEEQVYLLGYWLRNNITDIEESLAHIEDTQEREGLAEAVSIQLEAEFGLEEPELVDAIIEMWRG